MRRTSRIGIAAVAFLALGADECDSPGDSPPKDPFSDTDLQISQQLDLGRLHGEVVNKRVGYFVERHASLDAVPGKPYYCLDIRTTATDNTATDTAYCGVRQVVYDSVEIGTKLPIDRTYSVYDIAQFHGRIVDRQAAPWKPAWYIVIDHATEVQVYRVDPQSYYRYLELGQVLPFTPPDSMVRTASDRGHLMTPAAPAAEAPTSAPAP
ncbi:hypothetical protein HY635_03565 [Candidatus Uhrbacteria bacterium]|nr:hypothetical protein [Candidatus Uhrbacteria bacterium]